ncbi:MAG TPA: SpoIID/LytB domain-containing protein [Gemmatimonadaceae bacterium]|nr:SpoIID/LytB domain-containing protein [Gemmatimonadaceae bacterium]
MRKAVFIGILGAVACASVMPQPADAPVIEEGDQPVRIALTTSGENVKVGGTGVFRIYNKNSANFVVRGDAGETIRIQSKSGGLVAVKQSGAATSRFSGPFLVRASLPGAFVTYDGKRYRGELIISRNDNGILVVNRLGVESYLRGVVPLEIGNLKPGEEAAVQAQAVAARSYSYIHMSDAGNRGFDMYGSVQDQVYGGVDAEKPMSDDAVRFTRGMVLRYAGRIINTPYSSTCGGSTAATSEVWWRQPDQPYLRPVSDRIPGTNSFYCDPSSRFKWTTTFEKNDLRATLEKYLGSVTQGSEPPVNAAAAAAHPMSLGTIRSVSVNGRTASDRVASISIQTSRGNYVVRGNDIRFVLRTPSGGLLGSTYFTAESENDGGEVSRLIIHGGGSGHAIGMCQWGAIGRARAGQDYKTILTTYFPGTTVGSI